MKQKFSQETGLIKSTPLYLLTCAVLLVVLAVSVLSAVTFGTVKIPVSQVYRVILHELFGVGSSELGSGSIHDVVWADPPAAVDFSRCGGDGPFGLRRGDAGDCEKPAGGPVYSGSILRRIAGGNSGDHAGGRRLFGGWLHRDLRLCRRIRYFPAGAAFVQYRWRSNSIKLLLAGMALSSVCSAFSSFVVYFANDKEGMQTLTYWLMGSLAGAKWQNLFFLFPIVLVSVLFFWTQYRSLNLMLLGDEVSITLGTDLHRRRQGYLLLTSLVIGFVVYASGMIGFVGLVIPHLVRMLFGTDHKKLIPLSALTGAVFLVWADVLCRVVIPHTELPIGILISMIGGPCFIFLMTHKEYGFGGGQS